MERSGLSQPNASMHLACLGECGLVSKERAGRFVYYDLADKRVARLLDDGEDLLLRVEAAIEACGRYSEPRTRSRSRGRARR